jgi:hypothetical protein
MKIHRTIMLLMFVVGFPATSMSACLDISDQSQLTFTGLLTQAVFPGPPNYESIESGDKAETAYLLDLPEPICVSGDEFVSSDKKISTIHVYPSNQQTDGELAKLTDGNVHIVGFEAFGSHTGHHHAPLVVKIKSLKPL